MELRDLPSVDELARGIDDPLAVSAARAVIDRAREEIRAGADPGDLGARLQEELEALRRPSLRRVLNATGVIVHTNLGRAPLTEAALEQVVAIARGTRIWSPIPPHGRGAPPGVLESGARSPRRDAGLPPGSRCRSSPPTHRSGGRARREQQRGRDAA